MKDKIGYRKYRKKIDEILKNENNKLVGEITFYYDTDKDGIVMTHITTNPKELALMIKFLAERTGKFHRTDLGELK